MLSKRSLVGTNPFQAINCYVAEKAIQVVVVAVLIVAIALLTGCERIPENAEQAAFNRKIRILKSELSKLENTEFVGKGDGGKLAPSDISNQVSRKKAEILSFLHDTQPNAELWDAEIVNVKRSGNLIILKANYEEQFYYLKIFDNDAKKIAENITNGNKIQFSGNIGPEGSQTLFGALSTPEFHFYPTRIRNGTFDVAQPAELIPILLAKEQQAHKEEKDNEERQAAESELTSQIQNVCRETLLEHLKYPESANFPWFKNEFRKLAQNKWVYFDVVEAKNDFGGELPRRFKCLATTSDSQIEVAVEYLD